MAEGGIAGSVTVGGVGKAQAVGAGKRLKSSAKAAGTGAAAERAAKGAGARVKGAKVGGNGQRCVGGEGIAWHGVGWGWCNTCLCR